MSSANYRVAAASLLALLFWSSCTHAGDLPNIPVLGHVLHRLGPVGVQGWGATDVDGDGRLDLVTSADGPSALILVYGRVGGGSTLALKQSLLYAPDSIAALATATTGEVRVVSISPDGIATRFGGWPLQSRGTFSVAPGTRLARIGDIDGDGSLELVCAGEGTLSAYSLLDGSSKWSMSIEVADLALASLDADPALELIIAGGDFAPGYVLDGASRMLEWSRPEGFGTYVAAGRFGIALAPGFVGAKGEEDWGPVIGFSVAPYTFSWSFDNFDTDAVATGDVDADGRSEFAVGDGQWGPIRVYDAPTRAVLHEIDNMGHGLWALGMLDFDADARDEIWYSARIENSSDGEANFAAALVDPVSTQPRLTIESYWQGATATHFADLDQDGNQEWIVGTGFDSGARGLLRILDATSRLEEWRAPYENANGFEPFQMIYRGLQTAQLDTDPALELVAIGGHNWSDLRLLVIDGITHEVERQVPTPIERWVGEATATRLVQHVAGGPPELMVARFVYATDENVTLDIYSLPAGELLWRSPTVGSLYDRGVGIDVGQLDSDPAMEYMFVHTRGISVFDGSSGQTQWTLPIDTQGAIIVPTNAGNRIFSFTSDGEVTIYDPQTLLAVGGFTLPAPLESVVRLPERDDRLLAVSGEHLKLVDLGGRVLMESVWIGDGPGTGDNFDVVRDANGWLVSIGRSFTTFQLRLQNIDTIFTQGFE